MNILIITGGNVNTAFAKDYLKGRHFDRIIAADAGLSHCRDLGLVPTEILGDFDSLADRKLLAGYKDMGIPVISFPVRKDYTDTHLAVQYALDMMTLGPPAADPASDCAAEPGPEPAKIVILGATGSRYDHALANIGLLQWVSGRRTWQQGIQVQKNLTEDILPAEDIALRRIADQNVSCVIIDENNEIEMLTGPSEKTYRKDDRYPFFSLLAWGGEADGITLTGFSYPLENGTLTTDISLGISNEIIREEGRVKIKSGHLLVIRSRD